MIFDLGGVVLDSPLHAIAAYERELGIPEGHVNRVVVGTGPEGAWSRLERGELSMEEFYRAFDAECAAAGHAISAEEMMARIGAIAQPRPAMVEAIERIRARQLATAALTNNWAGEGDNSAPLRPYFDIFLESSVLGLRKPDPRIYRHALEALGVAAREAVFLDDIGRNVRAARELGIPTIKVEGPGAALDELAAVLGFALR